MADEKEKLTEEAAPAVKNRSFLSFIAAALTVVAWVLLMAVNGYAALGFGIGSLGMSIAACALCHGGGRRLAIACIIASSVLVIVVGGFLLGIRIALG